MNRESFSRTENGINVFMDIMTGTDSYLIELAMYTLTHFKYCHEALKVCIIIHLYIYYIKKVSYSFYKLLMHFDDSSY